MAIIKLGITVVGIRGTVGGGVFSANKSGPYLKQWAYPIVRATEPELLERSRSSALPSAWRSLTQAVRDSWDTLAALAAYERTNSLGEVYNLSGWQLYNSWQRNRQTVSLALLTTAPTATVPSGPPDATVAADESAGTLIVSWTAGVYTSPFRGVIYGQPLRNEALQHMPNLWRYLADFQRSSPNTKQVDNSYTAKFGPLQLGQAIAIKLIRMNEQGPHSTPLIVKTTVVA